MPDIIRIIASIVGLPGVSPTYELPEFDKTFVFSNALRCNRKTDRLVISLVNRDL